MEIIDFNVNNLDDLVSIMQSNIPIYFAEHEVSEFKSFFTDNQESYKYWIATKDNKVVAGAGIAYNEKLTEGYLCWGMVQNELRCQGIGTVLTKMRIEDAKKTLGVGGKIICKTTQHSYTYYQKMGFKLLFTVDNHWTEGMHLYEMELILE